MRRRTYEIKPPGSFVCVPRALDLVPGLSASVAKTLMIAAHYAHSTTGEFFAGHKCWAKAHKMKAKTVSHALRQLQELGIIKLVRAHTSRSAATYRFCFSRAKRLEISREKLEAELDRVQWMHDDDD